MLPATWANDSKITVTTIINLFPFIFSFFTETVIGKGGIARILSGVFWISPSASISEDFLLLICTSAAQRGLETMAGLVGCPGHRMLKPLHQCCSQVVSSFDKLQRSQLFQLWITWSTHPAANISPQKLQVFCLLFLSSFIYIAFPSVGATVRPFNMILESQTCP